MNILSAIIWDASPDIFSFEIPFIGSTLTIRWYGLLFASGFLIGQYIMLKIFKAEGKPEKDIDAMTLYMIVATLVGARLGHCLFYQPDYYLANPIEILKVWEGGLASHGATIGILLGLYLYSRSRPDQSYLWVLDRIVIVVALGGALLTFLGVLFLSNWERISRVILPNFTKLFLVFCCSYSCFGSGAGPKKKLQKANFLGCL
jgi:prolipoprotein diacylglyceryltransferase